ncbi:MAG: hypothetical protein EOO77_17780 [Oxalobacteraceae bacterium]|nr:MAG: hypothetical protein EOO77_17780 [Oxalobacteraceae bacterium]
MHRQQDTLFLGASGAPVRLVLTAAAMDILDDLPGGGPNGTIADHRALLTTITVARAAAGGLIDQTLVIDAADVREVLDHAGTARPSHAL